MIKELARMRFQSGRNPEETGAVTITEDGCLHVEPSEAFLSEMARLEDEAVTRSKRMGAAGSLIFFGIGFAIATFAWAMGRVGGEIRTNLRRPRVLRDVEIDTTGAGGIRVVLPGEGPQKIELAWERGEIDEAEAAQLVAVYERFKQFPPPTE